MSADLSRRDFMKASSALVVGIALAPEAGAQQAARPRLPGSLNNNRMLSSWLRVNADGTITVFTGKIELGQGIATAIAQIAADELDVDYKRIVMVTGDTSRTPDEGMTAGSLSMEQSGTAVRFACAEARQTLMGAAAAKLGVPAADLRVADGAITGPSGAKTSYWEVTSDAMLAREATAQAKPKGPEGYKYVGQSLIRRDIPPKFTGRPAYVQDMRLPNMLHGRVVRPPSPRAELVSYDERGAKAMPGVVAIVRDGNYLAVAAEREEQAIAARAALKASAMWLRPELPPTLADRLDRPDPGIPGEDRVVNEKKGGAVPASAKTLSARYTRPYQAHASMGPSCAVAQWTGDKATVWTHSQGVFPLRSDMARALNIPVASLTCVHREGAGCYGQNGADDVAFDALLLARGTGGRPVRLQWMREDEFMWEPFGSPMIVDMKAALDDNGNIVDWNHELWSYPHTTRPGSPDGVSLLAAWHLEKPVKAPYPAEPPLPSGGSDRNSIPLYEFPSQRITKHYITDAPIRTSALRTLGAYANVFALESFMDELALAANADPIAFRLKHLKDPRAVAVLEAVARMAKWQSGAKASASGDIMRGRGVAFAKYKNLACYCAVVADLEVNRKTGIVHVTHAWSAVDAGLAVNPDGVENQIEGGIIQSTSWTLKEAVPFDRSGVKAKSWADYPILRFSEVPEVEVQIVQRPTMPYLGVGEGSQGPTAAAIGNAFANATGRRLRDIPFTPEKVKRVLA